MAQRTTLSIVIQAKNLAERALTKASNGVRNLGKRTRSSFGKARQSVKNFATSMRGLVTTLAAVGAIRLGRKVFEWGANVEETGEKFRTTFGSMRGEVQQFLDDFANMAGLSIERGQEMTATLGAMTQGMGFTTEAAADFSMETVRVAADLQSFNNVPIEQTLSAIKSGYTGMFRPLRKFGVVLDKATVQQEAMARSGKRSAEALTQQEEVAATLALVQERAAIAMGDTERTADSAANTARRVSANFTDVRDRIAKDLLPAFGALLTILDNNREAISAVAGVVGFLIESFGLSIIEIRRVANEFTVRLMSIPATARFMAGKTLQALGTMVQKGGELLSKLGIDIGAGTAATLLRAGNRMVAEAQEKIDLLTEVATDVDEQLMLEAAEIANRRRSGTEREDMDDPNLGLGGVGGTSDEEAELSATEEAARDLEDALDAVQRKNDILGASFNATKARAKAYQSAIDSFVEAGLEAEDEIPGLGITLEELAQTYRGLEADLEAAEMAQQGYTEAQERLAELFERSDPATPLEEFRQTVADLRNDLAQGHITMMQFVFGMARARQVFAQESNAMQEEAERLAEGVSDALQTGLIDSFVFLGEKLGETLAGLESGMLSLKQGMLKILGSLATTIGRLLISVGVAGLALKQFALNPLAAIAAGTALVALGSALTSSVENQVSAASKSLAGGGGGVGAGASTANRIGASQSRGIGAANQGDVFLQIAGDGRMDMNDPRQKREMKEVLEELSGRRVIIVQGD